MRFRTLGTLIISSALTKQGNQLLLPSPISLLSQHAGRIFAMGVSISFLGLVLLARRNQLTPPALLHNRNYIT
jgi:hypothetical protein